MRRKNHAKYSQKSTQATKKLHKNPKMKQKRLQSPKFETSQDAYQVKQGKHGKHPARSGLCPCKNETSPKLETLKPACKVKTSPKFETKPPCKIRAKPQTQHNKLGKHPSKSKPWHDSCKVGLKSKPGTVLAKEPKRDATWHDSPRTKIVTSQDEASQFGAQKSLPSSENRSPATPQGSRLQLARGVKALGKGPKKSKDRLGTNLARRPSKVKPAKQPKTAKVKQVLSAAMLAGHKKSSDTQRAAHLIKKSKATPKLGSKAFKDLQGEWYAKLKQAGFEDLESLKSADGLDGLLSTRGAQPQAKFADAALSGRDLYYRRLTNFITHNPNWSASKLYNLVALLYIEGVSYRKILPQVYKQLKIKSNVWRIHKIVKLLEQRALTWNRSHHEGIDFVSDLELNKKLLK
jgi:hypothetical protein